MRQPRGSGDRLLRLGVSLCWMGLGVWGQTAVDLRTQSKAVDFTGAAFTRPVKTGVVVPGDCATGELFFKTDATPGSNLFACVAAATWVPLLSGGLSGEIPEFKTTVGGSGLTVNCPVCNYRIGQKVFVLAGNMTASGLAGTGGSSLVYIYLDGTGVPKFGYDGSVVTGATLSGLMGEAGVTQIPVDAIPVAACPVASNQFTSCTDLRAVYSRTVDVPGTGIVVLENPTTGAATISVNPAVVGLLGGSNTWTGANNFTGASHTSPVRTGTIANRPATCTVGELYFASDAAISGKNLHFCTAANTWTVTP